MSTYQPISAEEAAFWRRVREEFLIPRDEIYFNSGTLSSIPRCVLDAVIADLRDMEKNPTLRLHDNRRRLALVREGIAKYVGAEEGDLVLYPNVTIAINVLLRGQRLAGGEALISEEEYGACANALHFVAQRRGMTVRRFPLPESPAEPEEVAQAAVSALSPQTKLVMLSHVTSARGLVLPVARIAEELAARGVRFIVDGAHAPGLVPLDLAKTRIHGYGGNLHKWFMGPKGTSFAWIPKELQRGLDPLVVGFGGYWERVTSDVHAAPGQLSTFQQMFGLPGCFDLAPWLALQATLDFRARIGEERILRRVRQLTAYLRERVARELGWPLLTPTHPDLSAALSTFRLPRKVEDPGAARAFFEKYRITPAIYDSRVRISTHIYNSEPEVERLIECLRQEFVG